MCRTAARKWEIRQWLLIAGLISCGSASAQQKFHSRYEALWNSPWPSSCSSGGTQPDWGSFNISTNQNASFLGETVATIYSAGNYPMFSGMGPGGLCANGDWNCTNATFTYGGLPQLTNLTAHLEKLQIDVEKYLPDEMWSGVANIDWEAWKPTFDANKYNEYWIYVNRSEALVLQQHPTYSPALVTAEAKRQFNAAAKEFWTETMRLCRKLRPHGVWGYYNYPVDSWDPTSPSDTRLDWLYDEVTALFPSIYIYKLGNTTFNQDYVDRVMNQTRAVRDARYERNKGDLLPMYSFAWYDYDISFQKYSQTLLSPTDLETEMVRGATRWGLSGVLIWGASADVQNATRQCGDDGLGLYVQQRLGPAVMRAAVAANNCSRMRCSNSGRCYGAPGEAGCDCDKGHIGTNCQHTSISTLET